MFTLSCYSNKNSYYYTNRNENYYTITVKEGNDKECIKRDLTCCTESLSGIPDRECLCINDKKYSNKRATYLLTDDEAEELKKDSRVKSINLDRDYYDDMEDDCIELTTPPSFNDLKRSRNKSLPKRFKIINSSKPLPPPIQFYNRYNSDVYPLSSVMALFIPYNSSANPLSTYTVDAFDERLIKVNNNTGQLFRLQQKENPWIVRELSSWEFIQHANDVDTLKHKGAGEDVDIIVFDDGLWHGHVEFNQNVINGENPRDYRNGNALRQIPQSNGSNGMCNVLDIYLDGPALLDPDFFYGELSASKTYERWDGTIIPQEIAALDWWGNNSLTARSSKYVSPGNGGTATGDNDFGELSNLNYEQYRDPNFAPGDNIPAGNKGRRFLNGEASRYTIFRGRHGTSCGSLAYGRTLGWAYNCNKWSLFGSTSFESSTDTITIFHKLKPTPSNKKEKNPTIVSCSVSPGEGILYHDSIYFTPSGSETPNISGYYTFRDTTKAYIAQYPTGVPNSNLSAFEPYLRSMSYITPEVVDNSMTQAGDELIEAGVIWFQASKNGNTNQVTPDHPNFNNLIHSTSGAPEAPGPDYEYGNSRIYLTTSRRGFPEHMGKTEDYEYPVINIGALDNLIYENKEVKAPYSSNGNSIDLFAPGDALFGASAVEPVLGSPIRQDCLLTYNNSVSSLNRYFDGTSAATPVAAGFIATLIAYNREWDWRELKKWIKFNIDGQQSFLNTSGDPDTVDDSNWTYKPEFLLTATNLDFIDTRIWGSFSFTLPDNTLPKVPYLNWDIPST
jgi:hypothetical protein